MTRTAPRITPAYAGSTDSLRGQTVASEDHPRVCGEHAAGGISPVMVRGSPPRMRGAHVPRERRCIDAGITPAYAGSTCQRSARCSATGDHPRVCGEHRRKYGSGAHQCGSPPRMRGALSSFIVASFSARITPAYAGSTPKNLPYRFPTRDHPRVCGEHTMAYKSMVKIVGSPPRMRGAH